MHISSDNELLSGTIQFLHMIIGISFVILLFIEVDYSFVFSILS